MTQGHADHAQRPGSAFQTATDAAMTVMHDDMAAAALTGDADHDFLSMMIPHHEGAIAMARLVLVHGRDPLVRELAAVIIAGQAVEIVSMQTRAALLARSGRAARAYPEIAGTRGESTAN